jgi:REP element-mobilizing transposase RayT
MHLVMRSEKAKNRLSLLLKARPIQRLAHKIAERHGVRIHQYVNAGNHLHLIVQPKSREAFRNFLRDLTGKIAQLMTGARKGQSFGKFWDALAYTRVAQWGRAYRNLKDYLTINEIEAAGIFGFRKANSCAPPRGASPVSS